jgi:integrase
MAGRPKNTRRAYQADLEAFKSFTGATSAAAAVRSLMTGGYAHTQAQFARYQEHLLRTGKSRATTARYLASVRSTLLFAEKKDLITWTPPVRPPFPPAYQDTAKGDLVKLDQALEALSRKDSAIAVRDYGMVLLVGKMALRRNEVAVLAHEDLTADRGEISVRRTDGRPPDVLPVFPEAAAALARWCAARGDWSGPLFVAVRNGHITQKAVTERQVGRVMARYQLDSPRILRHLAFTSYLERTGGDLSGAMEFGRVRRPSTVRTYERNRQDHSADPSTRGT